MEIRSAAEIEPLVASIRAAADFAARSPKLVDIELIARGDTPLVGYISAGEVVAEQDTYVLDLGGQTAEELSREPVLVFARPQGETLSQWRERGPAVARVLSVLAELLGLLDTAHREGLLLSGISSESILVDRADRIRSVADGNQFGAIRDFAC